MTKQLQTLLILLFGGILLSNCTNKEIEPDSTVLSTAQVNGQSFKADFGNIVSNGAMIGISFTYPGIGTVRIITSGNQSGDYVIQTYKESLTNGNKAYAFFVNNNGVRYAAQSGTVKLLRFGNALSGQFNFEGINFQSDVVAIKQGEFTQRVIQNGAVIACTKNAETDNIGNQLSTENLKYEYTLDGTVRKFYDNGSLYQTAITKYNSLSQVVSSEFEYVPRQNGSGVMVYSKGSTLYTYDEQHRLQRVVNEVRFYRQSGDGTYELDRTTKYEQKNYEYDERGNLLSYQVDNCPNCTSEKSIQSFLLVIS